MTCRRSPRHFPGCGRRTGFWVIEIGIHGSRSPTHPSHAIRPIPGTRIRHYSSSGSAESAFTESFILECWVRNPATPRRPLISSLAVSAAPLPASFVGSIGEVGGSYAPVLGFNHCRFRRGCRRLDSASLGGEATGSDHPFLKLLGYVLIGVGALLGATAGLAAALGSDNPEWFI
jgi:hypothetical protein